ncbi:g10918 [Coccomyxa viridis]|uniref:protein-L-isoaspartate(D-aspartate) O-methyltransferase n=1 Tax=Coccomyxa viridis TaxID=1274662 RepID=A0ABP1GDN0_9CHLO
MATSAAEGNLRYHKRQIIYSALLCAGVLAIRPVSAQGKVSGPSRMDWSSLIPGRNLTNEDLVKELIQEKRLQHPRAVQALLKVDRKFFIRPDMHETDAYQDEALPIGYGQTISAPHMHAAALELLQGHLQPGASAFDVGSGSGYLAACMGVMVAPNGHVLGIEQHEPLAQRSFASIRRALPELMDEGVVTLQAGDALKDPALEEHAPFDAIHVGASAGHIPKVLTDKLKNGGRMVIPVGQQQDVQVLKCIDKDKDGKLTETDLMGVLFVPLKGATASQSKEE